MPPCRTKKCTLLASQDAELSQFVRKEQKSTLSGAKGQTGPKTKSTPETGCATDTTTYERASSEATVQHPANISFVITIASLD